MIEKKHRIEDALEAVRSAQLEGIVPGGGVALVRCTQDLEIECDNEEQSIGAKIILDAVKEPVRQMSLNAGLSAPKVCMSVPGLMYSSLSKIIKPLTSRTGTTEFEK